MQVPFAVWSQEWKNPKPEKVISTIDIESTGKGIPIILAITGKNRKSKEKNDSSLQKY